MIRATINRALILALILAGWWIYGCAERYPYTPVPVPTKSQLLIDQEVERTSKENEAFRKLKAAGCDTDNNLELVDTTLIPGVDEYIYECKLKSGTVLILKKYNGKWIIYGKRKEKNEEVKNE